jgi:hypothetical protein
MGEYNPHIPQILGQEWVGIKEQDVTFAPAVNIYELGHGFSTESSYTLNDAKFYINEFPPGRSLGQVFLATIYQQGKEAITGPVRSVVIPCNSALVSGGAIGDASDVADPSDNQDIIFPATGTPFAHFYFATNSYPQLLNGKRILGVNFLYTLASASGTVGSPPVESLWGTLSMEEGSGGSIAVGLGAAEVQGSLIGVSQLSVARLGEVDHFWGGGSPNTVPERLPWRYQGLQDFEVTSGSSRISVTYRHQTTSGWIGHFGYAALEVFYCEENRLYYGGKSFGEAGFAGAHQPYTMGANSITMRDTAYAASPILAVGSYTLVISSADLGDCAGPVGLLQRKINLSQYPNLNALRQLYEIPPHPGVQVNVTKAIDEQFTKESTVILPQLSLHTSGAPLTEVHSYGRQARAQVFGTQTATQEILDGAAGGAGSYPWVRYYARRFGNTTVPLLLSSPTISGSGQSVDITPSEFDALDEIVDGWKEVTLRFTTAPSMGAGANPQWLWSAAGELVGNRWEVLGCIAPAISGVTGNILNQAPSTQRLAIATYGAPVSGSGINLGWLSGYAPLVSATTDDVSSDAALMFAKDMFTVTGFGATEEEQEVIGIGLDCGIDPCCIPTAIDYVQLSWGLPAGTNVVIDTFTREVSGGWGTSDSGFVWSNDGGASQFSVDGSSGLHSHIAGAALTNILAVSLADADARVDISVDVVGNAADAAIYLRYASSNDYYRLVYNFVNGEASIVKRVGGVNTTLAGPITLPVLATGPMTLRFQVVGSYLYGKVWPTNGTEPEGWMLSVSDTSHTTGQLAVSSFNSAVAKVFTFDNLLVTPPDYYFGAYELQRQDGVETDWKTIMRATSPTVTGFNDYEARVGIVSTYRIRALDVYDFPGPWSSEVTATVPTPGVTIGCDDGHLLIFTSNEEQDGSINLAYSSVWEQGRTVEENFTFPESGFVQLQAMYNRDYFTAFRPTERGGEQFSRTVLVQAAAIAPETLGDFTGLRDMAWANVSYICVRDEEGNRWFATVLVPSGRVLRDRRLYMAPVDIIEVTDTPTQVNP